jgi:asparagine synthase (glutamine-hydrolysing)
MSDGFPGNRFLGASWRPQADPAAIARLRAAAAGWAVAEGPGWLLASERADCFAETADAALALGAKRAFDRRAATFPDPATVAAALGRHGASALAGMAPPFRAAWADKRAGTVHGDTDLFGLGPVFLASGGGFAALSSSATLLARVIAAPASAETLAGFALFGGFLAQETPFAGVAKLAANASATLVKGGLTVEPKASAADPSTSTAEALRASVAAMLKAVPDAELELSGGLDSRLILAAMRPQDRRGRRAITIGVAGEPSEDVIVAQAIAQAENLDWSLLDAGGIAAMDAPGLDRLLSRAAAAYDHMANPVDKVALITAGAGRSVQARFGGQNGEILRGFYYAGQPLDAQPSEALARRLVSWRLTANDKVDETVLAPALRGELRAAAEARMVCLLLSFGGDWGETLDRFYLAQRMQNWVGNSVGNRLLEHVPLYPFFDPAFVAAAMATPAAEKLNSRAAYRLLVDLDLPLARRRLAGGVVPVALPSSRLAARLADLRLDLDRVGGRLRRRLKGQGRATLGSQTVSQHWRRLKLHERLPVDRLARTGLFDDAALARVASGDWLPDRPTLGFLLLAAGLETRP